MNKQACRGCGSIEWTSCKTVFDKGEVDHESCDQCPGNTFSFGSLPDVYFDKPGEHHGICDPQTGKAVFIESKSHKANVMKQFGLKEVGDRVHGSRNFDPIAHRHSQESLRRKHNER